MLIIDRFEENLAVIENEEAEFLVERSLLPNGAREGDVLRMEESGFYAVDHALTVQRHAAITARLRQIARKREDEKR